MDYKKPINPIFNLEFKDLYERYGLFKINQYFLDFLNQANKELSGSYQNSLRNPHNLDRREENNLLISIGKYLEDFLTIFFGIKSQNCQLQNFHHELSNIYLVKRLFIQRVVAKKYKSEKVSLDEVDGLKLLPSFNIEINKNNDIFDTELSLANLISPYLKDQEKYKKELENIYLYSFWALYHKEGIEFHKNGTLFILPKKIDPEHLIDLEKIDEVLQLKDDKLSNRDGFSLTDKGFDLNQALGQANYCIFCHNQEKDSCKIGLKDKDGKFKKDHFNTDLSGCPLEERVSEMNLLKSEGFSIAALAIAVIDNPMIAGTGHRICNDCMKSCIFQKQESVDIPQIETRVLKDVLNLPFGFEIYSLLTRWNPLNLSQTLPKEPTGRKILVAGLGPAGYTLSHYLLNEGHCVVALDGLKIEPLESKISGVDILGKRVKFEPIQNIKDIYEDLSTRTVGGFGGVAEYGITSRWDKNFLKIIRLLLERRDHFSMFGGVRLGSTLDCHDAFKEYGFDHVALCLGAGWAKVPEIKNNLTKGVRTASDFLMALQLTGAAKKDLLSNLQVRLPIIVIGSGLTAIDTATESLAYYPIQLEKFIIKYEDLQQNLGKKEFNKLFNEEEHEIIKEFLEHSIIISQAKKDRKNITQLLKKLGGVKIIYRKSLQDSPAYRLNHEEMKKAFQEGIEFLENSTPTEIISDKFGHIKSLKITHLDQEKEIKAKSLFLAAGTTPNKAPFYEDKLKFELDNGTFQIIDLLGNKLSAHNSLKGDDIGFITARNEDNKMVSFFGDLHPNFNGSVVKAMASAKKGYKVINKALEKLPKQEIQYDEFLQKINRDFLVIVKEINILSDYFTEITVHSPILSKKTKLGHIFRLHNYHNLAQSSNKTLLAMEGVAVTTYKINKNNNEISVMMVNAGASSSLVNNFKVGDPLIFMGPSGTPAYIAENKTAIFIAGGRGIFPLSAIAKAYKDNNCKVILFCGFKNSKDLVRQKELESSCDELIISFEENTQEVNLKRKNDKIFPGNIIDAILNYKIDSKIDNVITMGSDAMMHKISQIYHEELKDKLSSDSVGIVSLNSPMQCMLKGVCSQCLQKKFNKKTGQDQYFYSCISQDQKLDEVNFEFLKNRCEQNSLGEKLTKYWAKDSLLRK